AVEVTVTGKKAVTKVSISKDVVDPEDVEMLEDLIMAATNEAIKMAEEESTAMMSRMTGGLGGGMPF
ncbi:MAG: YbaB/EbfC family nucleoid-associated protein, partial [Lachnospiraceae bacterium]